MARISDLDKNMAVCTRLEDPDILWKSALEAPFSLHGLLPGEPYRRIPEGVAAATGNEGVIHLSKNTAGGRLRFKTNSPYVAIHAEMAEICRMDHMAFTGIYGFDLYQRMQDEEIYIGTFRPTVAMKNGYESKLMLRGEGMREVTINFPLYNNVDKLLIGVQAGSDIAAPRSYAIEKPVVFYGSSITQGGCASRPGNCYTAMIGRMLDCEHLNLGFSGSARGEEVMADYIANLDMRLFVCDYDHNAPDVEHLKRTHLPLYRAVRAKHPDLPILLVSKPDHDFEPETNARRAVILETFQTAQAEGDRHIAFIDGATLFAGAQYCDCTVDGCHPNDLGFFRMAQVIGAAIKEML